MFCLFIEAVCLVIEAVCLVFKANGNCLNNQMFCSVIKATETVSIIGDFVLLSKQIFFASKTECFVRLSKL